MKKTNEANKSNPIPKGDSKHANTLVKIKEFDPAKHLLKVVRASDGEPLEKDVNVLGEVTQTKAYDKRAAKAIKTGDRSDSPIMEIDDDGASLRGSSDYGYYSYNKFGNIIKGPLSISAAPQEVRLSGVTTLNPLLTNCFPSTIVTPIPVAIWSIPGAGLVAPISKDLAVMATLIAAMGVG